MKKDTKLTSQDVKAGNFIVEITKGKKIKKRFFFIKGVKENNLFGFYLEDFLEDISLLLPQKIVKHVINLESYGTEQFVHPTQKRVQIIKKQLRENLEKNKEKIKQDDEAYIIAYHIQNMNPVYKYGVLFRDKSPIQKDDCLFCEQDSIIEAVYQSAMIRACKTRSCQKKAATTAKTLGK
jgi:hypothetical protein